MTVLLESGLKYFNTAVVDPGEHLGIAVPGVIVDLSQAGAKADST